MKNKRILSLMLVLVVALLVSCTSAKKQVADDAFFQAAFDGNLELVKEGVQKFDVNSQDDSHTTALMYAAFNGHIEIVKLLLKSGADVNLVNDQNRSALMFASTSPSVEIVKLLIDAGSDVNLGDSVENWTPFLMAAAEGLIDNMKVLADAGANVMAVDVDGETALDFAMAHEKQEAMVYLVQLGVPSKHANIGVTTVGDLKKKAQAEQEAQAAQQ